MQRSDTLEVFDKQVGDLTVSVSRRRDAAHRNGTIQDICVYQRTDVGGGSIMTTVWEIPTEGAREFIQGVIDCFQRREKWEREGVNWNLGEEGV